MAIKTKTRAATKVDSMLASKPSETIMVESLIKQIEATRSLVDLYRETKGEGFDDDTDLGYAYDCLTRAAEILEDELLANPSYEGELIMKGVYMRQHDLALGQER